MNLLLQAAPLPGLEYLKIIADLGMGAMVVWVLLHVFRKLIPDMQAQGIKSLESILAAHKQDLADMRVQMRDGALEDRQAIERMARALDRLTHALVLFLARQGGDIKLLEQINQHEERKIVDGT